MILLDELEKAHPDIFNILLQVMDNGMLTDTLGKQVNFRNTILIMTSNAGAAEISRAPLGFGREDRLGEDKDTINKMFSPEFRNRLDAVIGFKHLTPEMVRHVVGKFIYQLESQLSERNITISLSDEASDWLATNGYDKAMGARPLARLIANKIKKPLADEVLFGKLAKGGSVHIDVKDNELTFRISKATPKSKRAHTDEDELA